MNTATTKHLLGMLNAKGGAGGYVFDVGGENAATKKPAIAPQKRQPKEKKIEEKMTAKSNTVTRQQVIDYLYDQDAPRSRAQIADALEVAPAAINTHIANLKKERAIEQIGSGYIWVGNHDACPSARIEGEQTPSEQPEPDSFDEERMDVIGQNGNDGLHYRLADEPDLVLPEAQAAQVYEIRTLAVVVKPPTESIFSDMASIIEITDEGGGEFVTVRQTHPNAGEIRIDPTEWAHLRAAIDQMIGECRPEVRS